MKNFPVVLMGTEFWAPLRDLIENRLVLHNTIDRNDTRYLFFTDSPEEAVEFIQTTALKQFNFRFKKVISPKKILGER